jgi:hypothetical protein
MRREDKAYSQPTELIDATPAPAHRSIYYARFPASRRHADAVIASFDDELNFIYALILLPFFPVVITCTLAY